MLVIDTNLNAETLSFFLRTKPEHVSIWVEPISVEKSRKLASLTDLQAIDFLSPNEDELVALSALKTSSSLRQHAAALLSRGVGNILLTNGKGGVTWARLHDGRLAWTQMPAVVVADVDVVNTNGAGDCFVGGCVAALLTGSDMIEAIRVGVVAAALTVRSNDAVSPLIQPDTLHAAVSSRL